MRFKRVLAIILLLILPLQATLAAIDICCNDIVAAKMLDTQASVAEASDQASAAGPAIDQDCCTLCDFCHHATATYIAVPADLHINVFSAAPVPHPDLPIHSFIPDVPSRPDRA